MHRRTAPVALSIGIILLLSSCAGEATPSTTSTTLGVIVSTTAPDAVTPESVLDDAVSEAIRAGSYAFDGTVRLSVDGGVAETTVQGWVEGPNRMLAVEVNGVRQTTSVIDGTATVTRGDQKKEIALKDAGEAPSLELLRSVQHVRQDGDVLEGSIPSSVLTGAGFDVAGDAKAVIRLTSDGALAGYDLQSSDLTWSISIDFSRFGGTFHG